MKTTPAPWIYSSGTVHTGNAAEDPRWLIAIVHLKSEVDPLDPQASDIDLEGEANGQLLAAAPDLLAALRDLENDISSISNIGFDAETMEHVRKARAFNVASVLVAPTEPFIIPAKFKRPLAMRAAVPPGRTVPVASGDPVLRFASHLNNFAT